MIVILSQLLRGAETCDYRPAHADDVPPYPSCCLTLMMHSKNMAQRSDKVTFYRQMEPHINPLGLMEMATHITAFEPPHNLCLGFTSVEHYHGQSEREGSPPV
jgi:hypothetical protein